MTQQPEQELIWMTPEEEEKRIRKDERKRVLDEVYKRLEKYAVPASDLIYVTWADIDCLFAELGPED